MATTQQSSLLTTTQRHTLERVAGLYLSYNSQESDFGLSDLFSLGFLMGHKNPKGNLKEENQQRYKQSYTSLATALGLTDPQFFLTKIASLKSDEPWSSFSDFRSVWSPMWFRTQVELRQRTLEFVGLENHFHSEDPWGDLCGEEVLKLSFSEIKNNFHQIRVGALANVFKIDKAIAILLGWDAFVYSRISWIDLREKYGYPL